MLKYSITFLLSFLLIAYLAFSYFVDADQSDLETHVVNLSIENHEFNPKILNVPTNTKIILNVHNQDDTIEEFESIDLRKEKLIFPKSKIQIKLRPLAPGEYSFFGDFHQDTAQGRLIVK